MIASSVSLGLFEMHFSARGVLNEVVYEEATLRGPTPNLPFYVQLDRRGVPLVYTFYTDKLDFSTSFTS